MFTFNSGAYKLCSLKSFPFLISFWILRADSNFLPSRVELNCAKNLLKLFTFLSNDSLVFLALVTLSFASFSSLAFFSFWAFSSWFNFLAARLIFSVSSLAFSSFSFLMLFSRSFFLVSKVRLMSCLVCGSSGLDLP